MVIVSTFSVCCLLRLYSTKYSSTSAVNVRISIGKVFNKTAQTNMKTGHVANQHGRECTHPLRVLAV